MIKGEEREQAVKTGKEKRRMVQAAAATQQRLAREPRF